MVLRRLVSRAAGVFNQAFLTLMGLLIVCRTPCSDYIPFLSNGY